MKLKNVLLKFALCAVVTLSSCAALADIMPLREHFLAMPQLEWATRIVEEIAFFVVLGACVVLMVWTVVAGVCKRTYRRMFLRLLIALSVLVLSFFLRAFRQPSQIVVAGSDVIVWPKAGESYEEYLKRVDRLERDLCWKCDTPRQYRIYSWHCPKCEPDYFVCEKCGGAKEEAYNRGRYLRCPKCYIEREREVERQREVEQRFSRPFSKLIEREREDRSGGTDKAQRFSPVKKFSDAL